MKKQLTKVSVSDPIILNSYINFFLFQFYLKKIFLKTNT